MSIPSIPTAAATCGEFAAVGPASRRYRSTALLQQAMAHSSTVVSSKCEQCHVVSRRRKLNRETCVIPQPSVRIVIHSAQRGDTKSSRRWQIFVMITSCSQFEVLNRGWFRNLKTAPHQGRRFSPKLGRVPFPHPMFSHPFPFRFLFFLSRASPPITSS